MIYYLRKMEHHTTQRRVHSEDILALSGQQKVLNTAWLIQHGFGLLEEYTHRYGKIHSCQTAMMQQRKYLKKKQENIIMPQRGNTIRICRVLMYLNMTQALTLLLLTNVIYRPNLGNASNYLRDPSKKPNWL